MASPAGSYSAGTYSTASSQPVETSYCLSTPQTARDGYVNLFGLTFTVSSSDIPTQRHLTDGLKLGSIGVCNGRWVNTPRTNCVLGHRICYPCYERTYPYSVSDYCHLCQQDCPETGEKKTYELLDQKLQEQLKDSHFTCNTCDTDKLDHTQMLKHTCPSQVLAPELSEKGAFSDNHEKTLAQTEEVIYWLRTYNFNVRIRMSNIENETWLKPDFNNAFETHKKDHGRLQQLYKATSPVYLAAWEKTSKNLAPREKSLKNLFTDMDKLTIYVIHRHLRESCGCSFMDGEEGDAIYPVIPYAIDEMNEEDTPRGIKPPPCSS